MSARYKLGRLTPTGTESEHRYPGCWDLQETTGPERLVIAPADGQIARLLDLMGLLPDPFGLLYVLLVSRCDHAPGRYQSPYPTDRSETTAFLKDYRPYLEGDARHQLWVMSLPASSTLVYDQHNLIYAYGPLAQFQSALEVSGLERDRVEIPAPHTHRYHQEFDDEERRIVGHWPWQHFPLQPGDNP